MYNKPPSTHLDPQTRLYAKDRFLMHLGDFLCAKSKSLLIFACCTVLGFISWISFSPYLSSLQPSLLQPPSSVILDQIHPANDSQIPLGPFQPGHIIFEKPKILHQKLPSFESRNLLPENCLEAHIAHGAPCWTSQPTTFDVLWTWVNGSDSYFTEAVEEAKLASTATSNTKPKLYRDHDELRHSVRSVAQYFRPHTTKFTVVTSDFPYESEVLQVLDEPTEFDDGSEEVDQLLTEVEQRIGQLPSWLHPEQFETWTDGDIQLQVKFQAEFFRDYSGTSFNSYGIESQFAYLQNISENFLYLNDDFFLTSDLGPADFNTPNYGLVFRMQPELLVRPVEKSLQSPMGEWLPLEHTSFLLSQRFGDRARPYVVHAVKPFTMPLLKELNAIWSEDLSITHSHRFRGMTLGGGDTYLAFLFTHFVVERWREALLWSWVVGHIGGLEDEWGEFERQLAWTELGGDVDFLSQPLTVSLAPRDTLKKDVLEKAFGEGQDEASEKTKHVFSSGDGYPYGYTSPGGRFQLSQRTWPDFSPKPALQFLCTLKYEQCIGGASSASEAFKRIAFEKPVECGDCIIHALRAASGPAGLSAFIPPSSRVVPRSPPSEEGGNASEHAEDTSVPHLPLARRWQDGDYSLRSVVPSSKDVNIRLWTLRLLERYRFVIGETPTMFLMITSESRARYLLADVDRNTDLALLCLNDDVDVRPALSDRIVRDWLSRRFSVPCAWER